MSYFDRLIWLSADSFSTRKLKFDLVLFYDIVHDDIDVDLPVLDIVDSNVTQAVVCQHPPDRLCWLVGWETVEGPGGPEKHLEHLFANMIAQKLLNLLSWKFRRKVAHLSAVWRTRFTGGTQLLSNRITILKTFTTCLFRSIPWYCSECHKIPFSETQCINLSYNRPIGSAGSTGRGVLIGL